MCILCKLLTCGHLSYIASAYDMNASADRFTLGLTYFSRSQQSKCRSPIGIAEFAGPEFAGLENDGLENDGVEQEQTYILHTIK